MTYRSSTPGVYACGDARIGQSLIVTAIAEGRKCARVVNDDLGGSPMDADREMLAIGAWSGEADRTLRHEAEAAGTVRAGRGVLQRARRAGPLRGVCAGLSAVENQLRTDRRIALPVYRGMVGLPGAIREVERPAERI